MNTNYKILWADDDIELLRPHVLFLTQKGYEITCVTNGSDAVDHTKQSFFDIVFLDEQMPGIDGLQAMIEIRKYLPKTPIVMITKNEEERIMDKAIGNNISEYLIKPVNPTQLLLTCKKLLENRHIEEKEIVQNFGINLQRMSSMLMGSLSAAEWINFYKEITHWDIGLDKYKSLHLGESIQNQLKEANVLFGKYVQNEYPKWCAEPKETRPLCSVDLLEKKVVPEMQKNECVFFFLVDCMRYDQWLILSELLSSYFHIETDCYYSILPTATAFCRNAIFSGLYPADIQKRFPNHWDLESEEHSQNAFEDIFLKDFFERKRMATDKIKYTKISTLEESVSYEQDIMSKTTNQLNAVVINFMDLLMHNRTTSQIVKEITPDESAFRSLTKTWFEHSSFFQMLNTLSSQKKISIIITTDHGSIRCLRSSKINAEKETSTNMRFKFSRSLNCDTKHAIYLLDPSKYRLPSNKVTTTFAIAKEDYYFVYPNNFHRFVNQFKNSFQHGGVSLQEMIIPIATLKAK